MKKVLVLLLCAVSVIWTSASVSALEEKVMVVSYAGDVKVIPVGQIKPVVCKPGMFLTEGTRVRTGEGSFIKIAFDRRERNIVKVKGNSEVLLKLDGADRIELIDGKVFILLRSLKR
ncbi:MAG: hypothetical protein ABID83_01105, partial [Candidatus Omnitrophota bacterium]